MQTVWMHFKERHKHEWKRRLVQIEFQDKNAILHNKIAQINRAQNAKRMLI